MLTEREVSAAIGSTAYGDGGDKLGTVEHFFLDDRTGEPTWVAVTAGLFGTRRSLIPAGQAVFAEGALRVPVSKEAVRGAPELGGHEHLGPADEDQLRRHYGLTAAGAAADPPAPQTAAMPAVAPPPPPGTPAPAPAEGGAAPAGDGRAATETGQAPADMGPAPADMGPAPAGDRSAAAGDGSMVRSEERLTVDTPAVPTTRVRVVKHVVTEQVQVTVPLRREEIRVEEVPIDAADDAPGESLLPAGEAGTTGAAGAGLPDEIVLHAERPVVSVEVVPVERVRLRTEIVAGQETVTGQVQREQIAVDQHEVRRP